MITSFYAALLCFVYIYLSLRTIGLRKRHQVAIGDAGHGELQRAIRVHGNFSEYAPLALLLIFFAESTQAPPTFIHMLGVLLLIARCLHAYGVANVKEVLMFRQLGMVGTFGVMSIASARLLYQFIVQVLHS